MIERIKVNLNDPETESAKEELSFLDHVVLRHKPSLQGNPEAKAKMAELIGVSVFNIEQSADVAWVGDKIVAISDAPIGKAYLADMMVHTLYVSHEPTELARNIPFMLALPEENRVKLLSRGSGLVVAFRKVAAGYEHEIVYYDTDSLQLHELAEVEKIIESVDFLLFATDGGMELLRNKVFSGDHNMMDMENFAEFLGDEGDPLLALTEKLNVFEQTVVDDPSQDIFDDATLVLVRL
ncbi:MAG: hypothetical protein IT416_03110 [Candidatus Pacebacteria bacterium]|nr:hypothetical protein [Candidatus Paceibacterota bacterium]